MELITGYVSDGDDEEDGDSSAIQNSMKRKNVEANDDSATKRKFSENISERLPLPAGIRSMFVTEPEVVDDPDKHGGRVRTFAHERGNWASFVYSHVDPLQEEYLRELTDYLIDTLRPVAEFYPCEDLHISLSRTFVARHHWINPLVKCLCQKLSTCQRTVLFCCDLKWYCNDEKTRTFLAVHVGDEAKVLTSYTKTIDSALKEFKLPSYYENPSFHISLAWCLGDVTKQLKEAITPSIQTKVMEFSEMVSSLDIRELRLKTGNKFFSLPLSLS